MLKKLKIVEKCQKSWKMSKKLKIFEKVEKCLKSKKGGIT